MTTTDFKGKKVTVMGLGLHGGGLGVARWLVSQGARVLITDLKTEKQLKKSIENLKNFKIKYVLGRHREKDFKDADLIIQNPGVPRESKFIKIAEKNEVPIATDISIFFNYCPAPIIGITGTKGKTTITTLLGKIFKKKNAKTVVAGNIRKSPLDFLEKISKNTPVILELSSWQLEGLARIKKSPHIGLITNIFVDHLNRYDDLEDYKKAKKLIYTFQTPDDIIILNRDNLHTKRMGKEVFAKRFWFSRKYFLWENGVFIKGGWVMFRKDGKIKKILKVKDIQLPGDHNLENVLAAITVATVSKIPLDIIREVVKKFKGVENRMEFVRSIGGVKYFNDTTATAPEATINSLKTLGKGKNIILISGGADKELYFKDMAKQIKKHCKSVILLPGTATPKIKKLLISHSSLYTVQNMSDAVARASKIAEKGDIILLSPGCASFGIFVNEFDRGDQFVREVRAIGN